MVGGGDDEPPPPPHSLDPISGSSLHLPLMQMSWPAQSLRVLQAPLQEEMAVDRRGKVIILIKMRERETNNTEVLAILRIKILEH